MHFPYEFNDITNFIACQIFFTGKHIFTVSFFYIFQPSFRIIINQTSQGKEMQMLRRKLKAVSVYLHRTDKTFWLLTLIATVYGLLLILSQQRSSGVNFFSTQLAAVCLGYVAAVIISLVDYHYIAGLWWLIGAIALMLTMSVFFIGIQVAGTDDVGWISLPGGMTFQPSELTKICFIVTFSKHISLLTEKNRIKSFSGVISLLLHALIPVGLIHIQGDDGAALVFAFMFLIMSFAAGVQLRYFIILGIMTAVAAPLIWMKLLNSDQKNRLIVLFGADDTMLKNYGWQQYQGKVSIASGGIYGKGLFDGPRVSSAVVPYQENDFIFTVAGEELGFIGCSAIVLLFALLLLRTLRNASHAADPLGQSLCIGFFALLLVESVINLGMVLDLLPVIGVTLPFMSSGGTSVACLYLGAGLVQSVHMHPNAPIVYRIRAASFAAYR